MLLVLTRIDKIDGRLTMTVQTPVRGIERERLEMIGKKSIVKNIILA